MRASRLPLAAVALSLAAALAAGLLQRESPDTATAAVSVATVARHVPAAGPALSGDEVAWGEAGVDGGLAVLRARPGEAPRRVFEAAPATGENRRRHFGGVPAGLAGSASRLAFVTGVDTCHADGDAVSCSGTVTARAGGPAGPFEPLAAGCRTGGYASVAADGDTVATAISYATCDGREVAQVRVKEGDGAERVVYSREDVAVIRQVAVAGGLIAWTESGSPGIQTTLVVRELASGREVARVRAADFVGGRSGYDAFDVDADGTIVALGGPQPRCYYTCVVWMRVGDLRPRVVSRRALGGRVAISGGRILVATQRRLHAHRLVVLSLKGRVLRTLDRFSRRRAPVGELVLDGRRAAWGVSGDPDGAAPGGPGAVLTTTF